MGQKFKDKDTIKADAVKPNLMHAQSENIDEAGFSSTMKQVMDERVNSRRKTVDKYPQIEVITAVGNNTQPKTSHPDSGVEESSKTSVKGNVNQSDNPTTDSLVPF